MSRARTLADFISTGAGTGILADGAIDSTEITGVTVSSAEINRLAGVSGDVQTQINAKANTSSLAAVATSGAYADVTGTPSLGTAAALNVGTAASNIPQLDGTGKLPAIDGSQLTGLGVTQGTLTKTFTQNETSDITLGQAVTPAPVVSVTKEVPQTGVSTKGNWDVNSTASNYDFHNTAANVTLTPSSSPDLASSTYASVSLGVTGSYGPRFSSDGTKVFMNHQGQNYIRQSDLSTPWDISTRTGVASFSTASQVTDESGFCFSDNGLHFYLADANYSSGENLLHQYSITSGYPYDLLNYGSFTRTVNLTSLGESAPSGGAVYTALVEDSGTKMYIFTGTGSAFLIRQYTLSTAYDISSATYANKSFDVYADYGSGGYPANSSLSSDGTVLLLANAADDIVMQYELSTAWDISTASRVGTYNPSEDANVSGIHLRPDNSEFFMLGGSNGNIYKYTLGSSPSLALGSGSFASTDVGKRIVGNGGDVILTSTSGAFSTTGGSAFTDSSTIAAGSWSMFGLKSAGDASGITVSSLGSETAAYDSQLSLASQTTSPQDVDFNLDGGKAFIVNNQSNTIVQYNLSTPYLLSSASAVYNLSVSNQDGLPTGIFVAQTKMIVCGFNSEKLHLYNLGSNYNLSGSSFMQDFNLNTNGSYSNGLRGLTCQLDASGNIAQIFTVSQHDTNVRHWTPASLNQVSNLSLTRSLDLANVSGITGTPQGHGIRFNNNGTKLFIVDENAEAVYRLGLTTAYDISTASHEITYDISTNSTQPTGIALGKSDDSLMFITTNTGDYLNKYNLTSNFTQPTQQYNVAVTNTSGRIDSSSFTDINSMTAAESAGSGTAHYAVSTDGRTTWSVNKGTDGVRPIVRNNSGTWQYNNDGGNTSLNSNISSATYSNSSFSFSSQTGSALSVTFKPDGTRMYVTSQHYTYQYNLSTPFDLSTATYSNYNATLHSYDSTVESFFIKPDGTKAWFIGRSADEVRLINIGTAWELNTATVTTDTLSVSGAEANPTGLWFKPDGTKMYFVGTSNDAVWEYSLSTAWDVTTASYTTNISVAAQDGAPSGLAFNSTGTKMYVTGELNVRVFEYNLSTAWDVSSATYSNYSLSVSSQGSNLQSVFIGNNDQKIYVVLQSNSSVYEYSNASNAYATTATWANGTVNDELYTLQQALTAQSHNRMDKTQLDAIPDANHFSTGSSLDLMIALRMDTAASTLPTSDGVTLNYDAAALNEGAVLGTDYDFFFPSSTKVQIKSLAAQNLKVRVV